MTRTYRQAEAKRLRATRVIPIRLEPVSTSSGLIHNYKIIPEYVSNWVLDSIPRNDPEWTVESVTEQIKRDEMNGLIPDLCYSIFKDYFLEKKNTLFMNRIYDQTVLWERIDFLKEYVPRMLGLGGQRLDVYDKWTGYIPGKSNANQHK